MTWPLPYRMLSPMSSPRKRGPVSSCTCSTSFPSECALQGGKPTCLRPGSPGGWLAEVSPGVAWLTAQGAPSRGLGPDRGAEGTMASFRCRAEAVLQEMRNRAAREHERECLPLSRAHSGCRGHEHAEPGTNGTVLCAPASHASLATPARHATCLYNPSAELSSESALASVLGAVID